MKNDKIIKGLKEKIYLLELENEKLKIMNGAQEKVIKNIHIILEANASMEI